MNRDQRGEFVTFCTLLGYAINSFLPKWSKQGYLSDYEENKIKEAIRLFVNAKDSILDRMDGDYRAVVQKDSKELQIITLPKEKAKIILEKFKEEDETFEVSKLILDTMSSVTLELCSNCHKDIEEQFDCLLRICHFACGIEPFDPDSEGCPFKMTNLDMKNEFFMDFMQNFLSQVREKVNKTGGEEVVKRVGITYGTETSIKANLPSKPKTHIQKWKVYKDKKIRRWRHK
jgi:hypothetical protein